MGDVSEHFNQADFACRCGQCDNQFMMNSLLLSRLDTMANFFGAVMKITSGYRCPAHSVAVGGKADDAHTTGDAVDLATPTAQVRYQLRQAAGSLGFSRIGHGTKSPHLHLDVSPRLPQEVEWIE